MIGVKWTVDANVPAGLGSVSDFGRHCRIPAPLQMSCAHYEKRLFRIHRNPRFARHFPPATLQCNFVPNYRRREARPWRNGVAWRTFNPPASGATRALVVTMETVQ